MKSKRRIYIEAILFTTFCMVLAFGIPSILPKLPNWCLGLILFLWFPCGGLALLIFTGFLQTRFGNREFYKEHNILGAYGIVLAGMLSLIFVPLLLKLWYPKNKLPRM